MSVPRISVKAAPETCASYPLEFIVHGASNVLVSILDDGHHKLSSLTFSETWCKAVAQPLDRAFTFETGQTCAEHQASRLHDLVRVRSDRKEGFDSQTSEQLITFRIASSHKCHHLVVELE